jgi:hypothetical protein
MERPVSTRPRLRVGPRLGWSTSQFVGWVLDGSRVAAGVGVGRPPNLGIHSSPNPRRHFSPLPLNGSSPQSPNPSQSPPRSPQAPTPASPNLHVEELLRTGPRWSGTLIFFIITSLLLLLLSPRSASHTPACTAPSVDLRLDLERWPDEATTFSKPNRVAVANPGMVGGRVVGLRSTMAAAAGGRWRSQRFVASSSSLPTGWPEMKRG